MFQLRTIESSQQNNHLRAMQIRFLLSKNKSHPSCAQKASKGRSYCLCYFFFQVQKIPEKKLTTDKDNQQKVQGIFSNEFFHQEFKSLEYPEKIVHQLTAFIVECLFTARDYRFAFRRKI
jgi:hypothetical protein